MQKCFITKMQFNDQEKSSKYIVIAFSTVKQATLDKETWGLPTQIPKCIKNTRPSLIQFSTTDLMLDFTGDAGGKEPACSA